jgi:predicted ATPase/DNA-binding NarL/FixJ family response regulator
VPRPIIGPPMATPNNLPVELTSFVGREPQLAELRRLLRRSRLITLTGPGGAGKTRLALRLAAEALARKPDGVWLADLAPILDDKQLTRALAATVGVKEDSKRSSLQALGDGIGAGRVLVVLDGCEHLVESCAIVVETLLRSCPKLTILVTSREPLGVAGEVIWRTPSLTLPRPEFADRPELVMESEAVRLFVDRASLGRPEFGLTPSNARAVAQICSRLEGIPLAIELSAGLAGMMTLDDILDRLRHRFRLLAGGSRSSLARHQTLRQAVDWSYGLLSENEQALYARLGVFAGGFDLSAAEAVVAGDPISVEDVFPVLSRLVRKSLVVAEPARPETARYRMLDTIREYALERLQGAGQSRWRQKHAEYFAQWAVDATAGLAGADQVRWLRMIDEEAPNLRLALEWSLGEESDSALRIAAAMGRYWFIRGRLLEGLDWLGRALDVPSDSLEVRVVALIERAVLSRRVGEFATASMHATEAAELARRLGMDRELARAVNTLGILASHAGSLDGALQHFREGAEIAQRSGSRRGVASGLSNLALIESARGDHSSAQEHVAGALEVARELGDRHLFANILDTVARINFRLGRLKIATEQWREAISISAEFEDGMNIADCLEGCSLLAMAGNDAVRAVVLVAAADAIRARYGAERTAEWAVEVDESQARAVAKLGAKSTESARDIGAAMTLREAVGFALGAETRRGDGHGPLTDREAEVARLIANGMTNADVGEHLGISERTVDAHVEHIRNKLGLRSRTQIAVWSRERLGTA